MSKLLNSLLEVLPMISQITGGYATVTTKDGIRIKTYDMSGREVNELKGELYQIAKTAGMTGKAQIGSSDIVKSARAWALPLGDYVLSASNLERVKRDEELMAALKEALPFIAQVAGGEAVIFNKEGKRLVSVDSDGNTNKKYMDRISKAAKEAITKQKPVIGESMSINGAIGVRIPITRDFGFGFNNEQNVQGKHKLIEEVKKYQYARYNFSDIIGKSDAINKVKNIAESIAKGVSSVVIYGETGTGKELFAQSIHNSSERRTKPFVAINCAAIPATIIESYLFGYIEGAFTGAKKGGSPGSFVQADGGTIFLDEISEMDFNLQSKLLRVLQEREVTPIGGSEPIKIDVRVIAATNKDLLKMVNIHKFREDLYYRLNVVQVKIPSLSERTEDIPLLIKQFIKRYNKLLGKFALDVTPEALNKLSSFNWPGNVRQLQNCIEYAMNMVSVNEKNIDVKHLPSYIQDVNSRSPVTSVLTLAEIVSRAERDALLRVVKLFNGSQKDMAKALGISTTTLWRKMKEHDIGGSH